MPSGCVKRDFKQFCDLSPLGCQQKKKHQFNNTKDYVVEKNIHDTISNWFSSDKALHASAEMFKLHHNHTPLIQRTNAS